MEFNKYIHLERLGNDEVQGIEFGRCYIFPKLDGTNGSVWSSDGVLLTGSRNRILPRELSNAEYIEESREGVLRNDNQGFAAYIGQRKDVYASYFAKFPNRRLYGEWLKPHAFRGYRQDAWNKFYVFDVAVQDCDGFEHFIPFDDYKGSLEEFGLDLVYPQCTITNPTMEHLLKELESCTFLCEDGKGPGEGIVIKNYGFYSQYKRQVWAKLVRQAYKEEHTKFHGVAEKTFGKSVEESVIELFVTQELVDKEYWKIYNEMNGWNSRYIPRLFHTVFYCLVKEEMWEIMRKLGTKITINFGMLHALTVQRIKELKKELF